MTADPRTPIIRPAAVAGLFYPADPERLAAELERLLAASRPPSRPPRALIAPHAGYRYSGAVAARAYAALAASAHPPQRIVLLGPAHHEGFEGLAVPRAQVFATPLGPVAIDTAAVGRLLERPGVIVSASAHAFEHSLEVQLPFLRLLAPSAAVVPILTGAVSAAEVAAALDTLWDAATTLIVVSSDLSHYHPYATARERDAATAAAILAGTDRLTGAEACGCAAINGLNYAARMRRLAPQLLDLRNSGDTCGERQRVVGYGAFGYFDA